MSGTVLFTRKMKGCTGLIDVLCHGCHDVLGLWIGFLLAALFETFRVSYCFCVMMTSVVHVFLFARNVAVSNQSNSSEIPFVFFLFISSRYLYYFFRHGATHPL
jgi:uncharacterized membrane protein YgaE (UPF0421/DUF939 family)